MEQRELEAQELPPQRSTATNHTAGVAALVGGADLAAMHQRHGLNPATARTVAIELTSHDALAAHPDAELGTKGTDVVSAWNAAFAPAAAFILGAMLPLLATLLPPLEWRVPSIFVAVLVALSIAGAVGAAIGAGSRVRAPLRVVAGGALALAATFPAHRN
ncbi:VIT1/CCC1 transporter family protein [Arthrobacter sp. H20]|uniref:VIT1/CCC1 transporter family protein n=1 Tax=Arthrobacter sp. H20 TaxID=1267981 RepID=UPI0004B683D4|nr:VIT1/CCC1 transporter family protein [Arthrobacter sp. H20]